MSDDGESRPTPILASDAERERSIALLRVAVGEGRLTLEEFSERVGHAYAARTDQELASLARDLPGNADASVTPAIVSEEHRAFCSHLVRSGPFSLPRCSSWRSIFGTIDLDLRQARLAGPETVLEVYKVWHCDRDRPRGRRGGRARGPGCLPVRRSSRPSDRRSPAG